MTLLFALLLLSVLALLGVAIAVLVRVKKKVNAEHSGETHLFRRKDIQ
jgi:Tfp pilus assembly protein PilX